MGKSREEKCKIMITFGDYKECCNTPNEPIVHRCGICDNAFTSKKELNRHHIKMKEQKFEHHKPVRTAGSLCYLVDAQGFRVNDRGKRY